MKQRNDLMIRAAREGDSTAIAALSCHLATLVEDPDPGSDTTSIVEACFGRDRWIDVLVATCDGRVLGLAAYCRRFELHTRNKTLWLADLVVAETARGQGIGLRLINDLRRHARQLECTAIVADLWVGNASARAFYDRIGVKTETEIEIRVISAW